MIQVEIAVDRDIFDALTEQAQQAPVLFSRKLDGALQSIISEALTRLRATPGRPRYPIRWTSERQRRAFFATNGFGRGIPTRRSGKLQAGWKAELGATADGGLFTIRNTVPYEQYVTGINQQGFHADTGWIRSQNALADTQVKAEDAMIDLWFEVAT